MRLSVMLAICLVCFPLGSQAKEGPPNILLIIADQHTGSVMTQRGYPHVTTPGIDKIADAGVTFTRAYTPYPVCKAYRKSMMTGLMPSKIDDANIPVELAPPLPANFAIPPNEAEGFALRRGSEPGDARYRTHPTKFWTEDQWRQYMYGYDRLLEMVDAHIKLVIDELEAQGLLDNTVIIYTSDHGDGHAAHQWNQKMTFYEEAINVPFIVSWKGKTTAGYIDEITLSNTGLDIFPTILSFAGVPVPESLHGLDLTPQVLADSAGTLPERNYVVSEINQAQYKGRMVITRNYKYILFDGGENPEQLFDLANDPGELNPVTYDSDYKETLLAHRNMLVDWHEKIGDEDFDPTGKFPNIAR